MTGDGVTSVVDVQCSTLMVLWALGGQVEASPGCLAGGIDTADVDCNDAVTVSDVQLVIVYTLGAELPAATDSNTNQCADLCEGDLDSDGDGSTNADDCAPTDSAVYPGATEICNGVDDNCDEQVDEGTAEELCGDGDSCTADSCDPLLGICSNVPIACDDGDPCTEESCDPASGCVNEPIGCDDGRLCTTETCVASALDCPGGLLLDGVCYQGFTGASSWQDAADECLLMGSQLVEVHSADENQAVRSAADLGCGGATAWIGLSLDEVGGEFVWLSGAAVDYTNWNTGEPNNKGNQEDSAHILSSGKWNDAKSTSSSCYVCEHVPTAPGSACEVGSACDDSDACTTETCVEAIPSCCTKESGTGCGADPVCEDCVCEDSFCCNTLWDSICKTRANGPCSDACGCGVTPGQCVYEPVECEDSDVCTADSCDPATGCVFEPANCDDSSPCTADTCIASDVACPGGVVENGVCFTGYDDSGTWNQAEATCNGLGGHLASILSAEDNHAVLSAARIACGFSKSWIGLNTIGGADSPAWSSSDPVGYTNWASGEPSGDGGGDVVAEMYSNGLWNDRSSGSSNPCYVCQTTPSEAGPACQNTSTVCPSADACSTGVCLETTPTCCTKDNGVGCGADPICESCVCGADAFCCQVVWDGICQEAANDECATACRCDLDLGSCYEEDVECIDDGDVCTVEFCDAVEGCIADPLDCNDGDACTVDTCDPLSGCVHTTVDCDDGDGCTMETCDSALGCVYTAVECEDGDPCTTDECVDGACTSAPVDCNDDELCTVEGCVPVAPACDGGVVHGGSCFRGYAETATWTQAKAACEDVGGRLAVLDDVDDNNAAADAAVLSCGGSQNTWIGLSDEAEEGVYVWVNGALAVYTNWGPNEPNNFGGDEDYGQLRADRKWNDQGDKAQPCYVCEFITPAGTEGAATCEYVNACDDGDECTLDTCTAGFASNCCYNNGSNGCEDNTCQTCVCAIDSYCCNVHWDNICGEDGAMGPECADSCPCGSQTALCTHDVIECEDGSDCTGGSCSP